MCSRAGKDTKLPSPGIILEMRATMFPVSERSLEKLLLLKGEYQYNSRDGFSVIICKRFNSIDVSMKIPQYDSLRHHYLISNRSYYYSIPGVISHIKYYWKFYEHYLTTQAKHD